MIHKRVIDKKYTVGLLSTTILVAAIAILCGCASHRDEDTEKRLNAELLKHKYDASESLNLKDFLGENWQKICIPGPYQTQESFEMETNTKVSFYSELPFGSNILIFYKGGESKYLHLDPLVMRLHPYRTLCTSNNNPYLFFVKDTDGQKNYFFNDKD